MKVCRDDSWKHELRQRHGSQLGNIESLLHGRGSFTIRTTDPATFDIALQTARNLFQYFKADTEITDLSVLSSDQEGNAIRIACGRQLESSALPSFPINVDPERGVCILDKSDEEHYYEFSPGLGVAMLRPLPGARLELILWGLDTEGLRYAARLLPLQTGVGLPDFVVSGEQCRWKGAAGVLAMGFFDNSWRVSRASYLT